VKRWNAEEQRELDRTEQKETDEFSQRPSALGLYPRGA
jgi:flagellar biosynthesis chaperone FliJ